MKCLIFSCRIMSGVDQVPGLERIVDGVNKIDIKTQSHIMAELGVDSWEDVSDMMNEQGDKVLGAIARAGVSEEASRMWKVREAREVREKEVERQISLIRILGEGFLAVVKDVNSKFGIIILEKIKKPLFEEWDGHSSVLERFSEAQKILKDFLNELMEEIIVNDRYYGNINLESINTQVEWCMENKIAEGDSELENQLGKLDRYIKLGIETDLSIQGMIDAVEGFCKKHEDKLPELLNALNVNSKNDIISLLKNVDRVQEIWKAVHDIMPQE